MKTPLLIAYRNKGIIGRLVNAGLRGCIAFLGHTPTTNQSAATSRQPAAQGLETGRWLWARRALNRLSAETTACSPPKVGDVGGISLQMRAAASPQCPTNGQSPVQSEEYAALPQTEGTPSALGFAGRVNFYRARWIGDLPTLAIEPLPTRSMAQPSDQLGQPYSKGCTTTNWGAKENYQATV
jgi:hypothetical protein